jgi:hypothetical protein
MCCQIGISQQGFARAAEHLKHLAQLHVSRERLRQIVESEGSMACQIQQKGLLEIGFGAEDCKIAPDDFSRVYVGTDGAEWITKQFQIKLPMLDIRILDFYHFSEHVWSAANICFGQCNEQAGKFAGKILHIAKHEGPTALLGRVQGFDISA